MRETIGKKSERKMKDIILIWSFHDFSKSWANFP